MHSTVFIKYYFENIKGGKILNKKEYIDSLYSSLRNISEEEKRDILMDYEEHFQIGLERGLSEEEISKNLGSPEQIAKHFKYTSLVSKAEEKTTPINIIRVIIAGIGLGFFNLILGLPFIVTIGSLLISGAAVGLSLVLAGGSFFVATILEPLNLPFVSIPYIPNVSSRLMLLCIGIGLALIGVSATILFIKISKRFLIGVLKYIKTNVKIITG